MVGHLRRKPGHSHRHECHHPRRSNGSANPPRTDPTAAALIDRFRREWSYMERVRVTETLLTHAGEPGPPVSAPRLRRRAPGQRPPLARCGSRLRHGRSFRPRTGVGKCRGGWLSAEDSHGRGEPIAPMGRSHRSLMPTAAALPGSPTPTETHRPCRVQAGKHASWLGLVSAAVTMVRWCRAAAAARAGRCAYRTAPRAHRVPRESGAVVDGARGTHGLLRTLAPT